MRFVIRGRQAFQAHETSRFDELNGRPLATFRRRSLAFLIDSILVLVIQVPIAMAYESLITRKVVHFGHVTAEVHTPSAHALELVVSVLYFGLLLYWGKGRTPGKRLMRIRVLSLTHHEISLWQSVERALGYGASALEGGFGFIQYWINRNRQTVHDRIAETIVVDDRRPVTEPEATVMEPV